ncbi:hypothetical protein EA462_12505 [Natrarchaeobius halalkaliphilus]|uniref:Uncharacterized protein n=1 Tax=Natrarchaeobius halalkaliphilus TaxID=1679091 RepID=A0A3N6M250_9EURY|nr:hypothetical protein [Natrarchaeobius halalkaliphilus]RQG89181.1 hypothetical protein EA462_12505 [Natrarchaeobius halalkaliphilus]
MTTTADRPVRPAHRSTDDLSSHVSRVDAGGRDERRVSEARTVPGVEDETPRTTPNRPLGLRWRILSNRPNDRRDDRSPAGIRGSTRIDGQFGRRTTAFSGPELEA